MCDGPLLDGKTTVYLTSPTMLGKYEDMRSDSGLKGSASFKMTPLFYCRFQSRICSFLPERSGISEKLAKNTGPSGRTAP